MQKKILAKELNLAGLENEKKAKKVIDYVKSSFEWNGYYGKYASQSARQFYAEKSGNVADINLFLIALLNEAGIKTEPLILSTRKHGKIPSEYPFDHFTNYVIALVNTSSPFFADGTEDLLSFNKIPMRCINEKGLIVEKGDNVRWINLANQVYLLRIICY